MIATRFFSLLVTASLAACATAPASTDTTSSWAAPESVGMSSERLGRVDAFAHGLVDNGAVAGVVTLVAREGETVHLDAYGLADVASGREITTDDYFYLYSMTKPVTSVALLMLYEEGAFQLTDPLAAHLPEYADLKLYAGENADGSPRLVEPERQPTIQDVFRHTAGFTYGVFGDTPVDALYNEAGLFTVGLEDFSTKLGQMPLLKEPGQHFHYSVAHDVQARLVEVLSGMSFDDFCRTRIFEPLGMTETFFGQPEELKEQFALIHTHDEDGTLVFFDAGEDYALANLVFGGHSLSATITDYAKFAQMLLNEGELDGTRILSPKTVELMTMNHLPDGASTASGDSYGLGVRVVTDPVKAGNITSEDTFGWSGAAGTHFFIDPDEDLLAIFMIQHMQPDFTSSARFETAVTQAIVD